MKKDKKKPLLPRPKREYSDALDEVNLDQLQLFITKGSTENLPDEMAIYMELLEMVRSMYNKYQTKSFIINTLLAKPYYLSRHMANKLYFDSINFFYADNDVKQKAWENVYAQHLDNLAYFSIETGDIETARRCFIDAAKMRGAGRDEPDDLPKELYQRPVVIYTMDAKKAGLPSASRDQLGAFIDSLPDITEREKVRLLKDAGVTDMNLFDDMTDADPRQNH